MTELGPVPDLMLKFSADKEKLESLRTMIVLLWVDWSRWGIVTWNFAPGRLSGQLANLPPTFIFVR